MQNGFDAGCFICEFLFERLEDFLLKIFLFFSAGVLVGYFIKLVVFSLDQFGYFGGQGFIYFVGLIRELLFTGKLLEFVDLIYDCSDVLMPKRHGVDKFAFADFPAAAFDHDDRISRTCDNYV